MNFQPKLAHQGFIIVAIFVAFDLIFSLFVASLLSDLQSSLQQQRHAKRVLQLTCALLIDEGRIWLSQTDTPIGFGSVELKETFTKSSMALVHKLPSVADLPAEQKRVSRIVALSDDISLLTKRYFIEKQNRQSILTSYYIAVNDIFNAITDLNSYESEEIDKYEKQCAESRDRLKTAVGGGVCINLVLAVLLIIQFNQSTARRLAAID